MSCKKISFSEPIILVVCFVLLLANAGAIFADVKLPAVIGDNMVLQQGKTAHIWGWAEPGEQIMVNASWRTMAWGVTANKDGRWSFEMSPIQYADVSEGFS